MYTFISGCDNLTSLTLSNLQSFDALAAYARELPNLEKLHLGDCSEMVSSQLTELSALASEGPLFPKLKSLRFQRLKSDLTLSAFNDLFGINLELSRRLTCLGIEFIETPELGHDLDQTFRCCENLEELRLQAPLRSPPDFRNLRRLKTLSYDPLHDYYVDNVIRRTETPAPLTQLPALTDLTIAQIDLPPRGCSDEYLRLCFEGLQSLNINNRFLYKVQRFQLVCRILSICRKSIRSFQVDLMNAVQLEDFRPFGEVSESDFQFTHLDLPRGGEILFKHLPTPNLRHVVWLKYGEDVMFKYCALPPGVPRGIPRPIGVRSVDASTIEFIERVCDASAASMRHLELNILYPLERMSFFSRMTNLETLRLILRVATGVGSQPCHEQQEAAIKKFVRECNRLFPVDSRDSTTDSSPDELNAFLAMKRFDVYTRVERCNELYDLSYSIRKTCFGRVERFLGWRGHSGRINNFVELDALDVWRDAVPGLPITCNTCEGV